MGLDTVELVMAFEEKFEISIPDADASELTTPRKVIDYLMDCGASKGRTRTEMAAIVRQVITDQTAAYDFTDDSRFVEDMHLS